MEFLREVDWRYIKPNPKKFIEDDANFEKTAMGQLLRGTFRNPLLNVEEESGPSENEKPIAPPRNLAKNVAETPVKFDNVEQPSSFKEKRNYIPGFHSMNILKKSKLDKKQHELCVKVLLGKNNHCINMPKPNVTAWMIQCYNDLIPIIKEEQALFMEFVKIEWNNKGCMRHFNFNPDLEVLIDDILKGRKNMYKKYPQHYIMATMVSLVYTNQDIPIETELLEPVQAMHTIPNVRIPSMERRFVLSPKIDMKNGYEKIKQKSISEDIEGELYAVKHQANIVISSSGLKTLANNQDQFSSSWTLPVLVKSYHSHDAKGNEIIHNIVYIDRSLQSNALTEYEKTHVCYKYLLKSALKPRLKANKRKRDKKVKDEIYCEQCLSFIEDYLNNKVDSYKDIKIDKNSPLLENFADDSYDSFESENNQLFIDATDNPAVGNAQIGMVTRGMKRKSQLDDSLSNPESDKDIQHSKKKCTFHNCTCSYDAIKKFQENGDLSVLINYVNSKNSIDECKTQNVSYCLWRLGQIREKNKLSKDLQNDLKLLIRSKQDSFEMDENNQKKFLMVSPKMEYQSEYGAEVMNHTEVAQQWTALKFNHNSNLLRGRIKSNTGEVLMIEKLSLQVLSNEATKNTGWRPERALGCFFNVFSKLSKLPPGQYMLNHEPQHHAFAVLYSQVENKSANGLDLEEKFSKIKSFPTNLRAPWIPIDPCLVTPNLAHHNVMPAMFNPVTQLNQFSKFQKKNNSQKKKSKKKQKK